jgi:hypothetical protein
MMNEKRLAEQVVELAKAGMKVYQETQLEKNKQALLIIMGADGQKMANPGSTSAIVESSLMTMFASDRWPCT